MNITFYGACQSVTGSQHLLDVNGKKILLECGLYQGRRADMERINRQLPYHATDIDAVILSHAHIDHSGNLPNLVKQGFSGPIISTRATATMLHPMLLDSARIQLHDVEYLNKKLKNSSPVLEPIYTEADAMKVFQYLTPLPYHEKKEIFPGVQLEFFDAGHILGSALIRLEIEQEGRLITVGYTGDLGRKYLPILRDPEQLTNIDYLLAESTYGDRLHNDFRASYDELAKIIQETAGRGGKVIIPSFAVERAQELLYIIHELKDLKKIPDLPVYLDSPLAVKILGIFAQHIDLYDDEARAYFLERGENPFIFSNLHLVESTEGSKALNTHPDPCVIIAASGMCEFGRIRHHLKNHLDNPANTVAIVGYQAKDTLGRRLLDGVTEVNILDARIKVRSQIKMFNSLSAHADQNDLINFIVQAQPKKQLFLVHGEEKAKFTLRQKLFEKIPAHMVIPECGQPYELN